MGTSYESDVILWSQEQAQLLRSGQWSRLDIEHLADEIEDVGKSEKRELASRLAVLMAHLLKWQYQPQMRATGSSWKLTIREQRKRIEAALRETPSLKATMRDPEWLAGAWSDALLIAARETGLEIFPEQNPWSMEQVLSPGWLPSA